MNHTLLTAVGRYLLIAIYLFLATSILLFTLLEIPAVGRAIGPELPYYSIRRDYQPDSVLVFTPSHAGAPHRSAFSFRGDLYFAGFGVDVPPVEVDITYDSSGFRTNGASAPYDVAVIGDSYIELSETDQNTFSELLRQASGRSVLNRGRAWYGPHQYVELLRREIADLEAEYALFMFYSGNDIADIGQYHRWLREGRYHGQDERFWKASFPRRYLLVLGQAATRLQRWVMPRLYLTKAWMTGVKVDYAKNLTFVRVGEDTIPMVMGPLSPEVPPEPLQEMPEWQILRRLLEEFQATSRTHGTIPVLVYLPTKMETYAELVDPNRSGIISGSIQGQRRYSDSRAVAMANLATELRICFVDLLPPFRTLATRGELLYHPFDTHWNERGRRAAAEAVAEVLGDRC